MCCFYTTIQNALSRTSSVLLHIAPCSVSVTRHISSPYILTFVTISSWDPATEAIISQEAQVWLQMRLKLWSLLITKPASNAKSTAGIARSTSRQNGLQTICNLSLSGDKVSTLREAFCTCRTVCFRACRCVTDTEPNLTPTSHPESIN